MSQASWVSHGALFFDMVLSLIMYVCLQSQTPGNSGQYSELKKNSEQGTPKYSHNIEKHSPHMPKRGNEYSSLNSLKKEGAIETT